MADVKPHVVYFDIETRLSPDDVGWGVALKGGAGISAIVIYDAFDNWVYMYDSHSIEEAIHHLQAADIIVSWNGKDFDIPVMENYAHQTIKIKHHFDVYAVMKKAMGGVRKKGSGMGPTAERTIGMSKSGHGADAPRLVAKERFGELFNYCAKDVYVLKSLVKHVLEHEWVIGPDGDKIKIAVPSLMKANPTDVV